MTKFKHRLKLFLEAPRSMDSLALHTEILPALREAACELPHGLQARGNAVADAIAALSDMKRRAARGPANLVGEDAVGLLLYTGRHAAACDLVSMIVHDFGVTMKPARVSHGRWKFWVLQEAASNDQSAG